MAGKVCEGHSGLIGSRKRKAAWFPSTGDRQVHGAPTHPRGQ